MPARTTPFQMTVHFLRQHWAGDGTTVTESAMLRDSRPGIPPREVDVVVEAEVDGEPVVISFEVIEHGRPAQITWAEQMIAKHRYLPTNRLVLVSKAGFSKGAMTAVEAEGGWVAAVTPEVVETENGPAIRELFVGTVQLRLLRGALVFRESDEQHDDTQPNPSILSPSGNVLGTAKELGQEILKLAWVGRRMLELAYNHSDRENLTHFTIRVNLDAAQLAAQHGEDSKRDLLAIELVGEVTFALAPLVLDIARMSGRRFASGTSKLLGRDTLWVGTDDAEESRSTLSFRTLDDQPIGARDAMPLAAFEPYLSKLTPPPEWLADGN